MWVSVILKSREGSKDNHAYIIPANCMSREALVLGSMHEEELNPDKSLALMVEINAGERPN